MCFQDGLYNSTMPSKITCFWLVPTQLVQVSFRRYSSEGAPTCTSMRAPYPGHSPVKWYYHSAEIDTEIVQRDPSEGRYDHNPAVTDVTKLDARWPHACACGYVFVPDDKWQHNHETLYLRVGTSDLYTIAKAPAGAMYDAWWYGNTRGSDGKSLVLKTPEGDWWIDGPATNGPGWTRTGVPPRITCTPSIGIGSPQRLHGWLRDGVLDIDHP